MQYTPAIVIQALGRAAALLLIVSLVSLVFLVVTGRKATTGESNVWTFDSASRYPSSAPGAGPISVQLSPLRISEVRTGARALSAPTVGANGPSLLIETEISTAGKYLFKAPEEAFFLALDDRLAKSTLAARLLPARLESWRRGGGGSGGSGRESGGRTQFFLPRDVHPVTLTYRADLFAAAGIDLDGCRSWPELMSACSRYEDFYAGRGEPWRKSIELPPSNAGVFQLLLQQRGIEVITLAGRPDLRSAELPEMLWAYAGWVRSVGAPPARTMELTGRDLERGALAVLLTPDWKAGQLKRVAPALSGKLKMRALPVFSPGDVPTATWGGTGVGIPRDAPEPDAAWKVLLALYADREIQLQRYAEAGILPPLPDLWTDARITAPDPFFSNQHIGELQAALARVSRPVRPSPLASLIQLELNGLVNTAVSRPASLADAITAAQRRLDAAAERLLPEGAR